VPSQLSVGARRVRTDAGFRRPNQARAIRGRVAPAHRTRVPPARRPDHPCAGARDRLRCATATTRSGSFARAPDAVRQLDSARVDRRAMRRGAIRRGATFELTSIRPALGQRPVPAETLKRRPLNGRYLTATRYATQPASFSTT